ncbi:hypothetical protein MVLG_05162 [Microbotryum lychnidis-dioicae p1A1 Lamole]|uniref:Xaa-Pro dipeptidyl-peptidase C-terminal domain-containing protein n=1 Tax=Microbotryum lychnidis-dioicae (strain p1A1 Lamole / MvSl-1064) TaxID=683840 RepID=U5HDE7_USTV1|nr:hypothetical protein MVLG_05162 [Microbotryum lychnidis-dioicae p1A1 Lamole]|eukprot:KDE04370.1 hypothetical protein MVLG_05162 [Microbotryum lychnidis-dioicae p1A1 Lamole]
MTKRTRIRADTTGTDTHQTTGSAGTRSFIYTFDKQTRIVGLPKAHLFVSCTASDDLCIYVELRNSMPPASSSSTSKSRPSDAGSRRMLRASRRKIDPSRTWHPNAPFHPHDEDQKIPPGQIVELEIGIWHMGVQFEAGESLRFDVFGQSWLNPELKEGQGSRPEDERNKGEHMIHFGGEYPSRVILPIVPM